MKTKIKSKQFFTTDSEARFLISFIIMTLLALALASCSEDDAAPKGPDTRAQFVGDYAVAEISAATGNDYNYNVSIVIGASGDLEISNFGGVFNVPVKAIANGTKLEIKSQKFTNPNGHTTTVWGSGTIAGNTLTFTYTMTGTLDYTGNCTATRE